MSPGVGPSGSLRQWLPNLYGRDRKFHPTFKSSDDLTSSNCTDLHLYFQKYRRGDPLDLHNREGGKPPPQNPPPWHASGVPLFRRFCSCCLGACFVEPPEPVVCTPLAMTSNMCQSGLDVGWYGLAACKAHCQFFREVVIRVPTGLL